MLINNYKSIINFHIIYWLIWLILWSTGYTFRGYFTPAITAFLLLTISWSPIFSDAYPTKFYKIKLLFLRVSKYLLVMILFFNLIFFPATGFSNYDCGRNYISPSGKHSITILSCGLTCTYSVYRNYGILRERSPIGDFGNNIAGKCDYRYNFLQIRWNKQENQILWELSRSPTSTLATVGRLNPQLPLKGSIKLWS